MLYVASSIMYTSWQELFFNLQLCYGHSKNLLLYMCWLTCVVIMCRYELPQPGTAQKNDVAAWQESVDNSLAQLEHQAGR